MGWINAHRKMLVVVAGIVVGALGQAVGVDSQAYNAVVAVLTAFGVYGVANVPNA